MNKYGSGPFCKFKIPAGDRRSGVYAIVVDRQIKYVGKCFKLSSRFNMGYGNISPRNCFKGGQETNCRINNLMFDTASTGEKLELWFHATGEIDMVEPELRAELKPAWNRI